MIEGDYQAEIMRELSRLPHVRVHRQNVGSVPVRGAQRWFHAGPPPGAADISGIIGGEGWRLEIECKVEGRKRRAEQIAWSEVMIGLGAVYLHVDEKQETSSAVVARVLEIVRLRRAGLPVPRELMVPVRQRRGRRAL